MKLREKKDMIELLENLRILNYKSAFIYKVIGEKEKRLMLKNFYLHLYQQKVQFRQEIDDKIELLKREISPIQDPKLLAFYKRKKCEISRFYLKYKLTLTYADIHEREEKAYKKYCKYLSQINHGGIRAILLSHRHKIKQNLSDMNNSGIMKFPIA